ncbi:MAG TPA: hypothetical protein VK619_18520 [Pyrinomonadaceae bacterium]|nr:hypothetical protein [Pyrinomonadaceae bacterium]
MLPESTPLEIVRLPLVKLEVPVFYHDLFFATGVQVFNYPPDPIICVRPLDRGHKRFEIITGVELYILFHEQGKETIPAVITDMTDGEARVYATDHALRTAAQSERRSVVQMIVAARDNAEHGGVWSVDRLTGQIGIKRSTYTHALSSINYVCFELMRKFPVETEGLGMAELVAKAVREDFMSPFTKLYQGGMSVNKFYREYYMASDLARERSRQQQEAKASKKPEVKAVEDTASGAKVIQLARPGSSPDSPTSDSPNQLMLEGFIKFAQSLARRREETGASPERAEKDVTQQISDFLGKHQQLEGELLHFCNLILKHLKKQKGPSSLKSKQGKSKIAEEEVVETPKPSPKFPLIDSIQVAV